VIVHFAAETHVTRSETEEDRFFHANVEGTRNVMEAARSAGVERVVHVSTDEVYGPALDHPFTEDEKRPGEGDATSAYARSKALADDLAMTYANDVLVIVARPTNCFGPWQHPEKAVPRWTTRALSGERLPVWGDGAHVRDWMFVDDACAAIDLLINKIDSSGVFNIGPENEAVSNLEFATMVAEAAGVGPDSVYLSDYDRPQHDRRYSVDTTKIKALGWEPRTGVAAGIRLTVDWYRAHRGWWEELVPAAEALYADHRERT
jgi:dTDP-glucose 4,6-dehydratase